jgi:PAS domain S-box-containing protein
MTDLALLQEQLRLAQAELVNIRAALTPSDDQLDHLTRVLQQAEEMILRQAETNVQQQEDLDEYRKNLDIVFSGTQEGILLLDTRAHVVLFNKAFANFQLEYTGRVVAVGTSFEDLLVPERAQVARELFQKALRGETTLTEGTFQTYMGKVTHSLRYQPVYDRERVTHVLIISYDVSEKKAQEDFMRDAEENYLRSQHKFKALVEHTDDVFSLLDAAGIIQYASPSFTRILGYSWPEIEVLDLDSMVHPEDRSQYAATMASVRTTPGQIFPSEFRAQHRDGHWLWLQGVIINLLDSDSIRGIIINYRDVSRQRDYEHNITAIARELEGLIENSGVPIFGVDNDGKINEWNAVTAITTDYSKAEALGLAWVDVFIESQHRETVTYLLGQVLKGESLNNFELPILTRRQAPVIFLLNASPRYDSDNVIKGIIMVAQNITELIDYRHGLEKMVQDRTRELNEVVQKEKALAELKSKFVSMASHEFRIPLVAIAQAARQITTGETLSAVALQKLDEIQQQVDHMRYLLEDVLTVGKTDAGKVQINAAPVQIAALFETLCEEVLQSSNRTNPIRLSVETIPGRESLKTDSRMLRVIMVNLLTNAVKFSAPGKPVTANITVDNVSLILEVKDSGIGIPEEDQARLFQSFHRASNARQVQGTGLGLSIVRKTVDLLGGTIQVESRLQVGTTFRVIIPVV